MEQKREKLRSPEAEFVNKFTVRGTLLKTTNIGTSMSLLVATNNLVTRKSNYLNLFIFDRELIKRVTTEFEILDRITAEGYAQGSRAHPEGTLVLKEITRENKRVDAAFENEEYKEDMNVLLIKGKLFADAYSPKPGVALMTIQTINERSKYTYIDIVAFGKIADKVALKKKGESIKAICTIRSQNNKADPKVSEMSFVLYNF